MVRGLSGSARVELPCSVDQANCGDVYYITWTKQQPGQFQPATPQNATPILLSNTAGQQHQLQWNRVYLYTGSSDLQPHKPIGELLNRAQFLMPDRREAPQTRDQTAPTARLVIEEPRASDEALYKCDVTYVKGKCPSISLVRLNMLVLPSKAQIIDLSGQTGKLLTEAQLVGPYDEQQQLRLACLVTGGRPGPRSVIWRRIDSAGRTTNLQSTIAPHRGPKANSYQSEAIEIELNHTLSHADLGARFECHVEHEAIDLQPMARIVNSDFPTRSLSTSKTHSLASIDSSLDLHPARDLAREETPSNFDLNPRSLLDSYIQIDLNVAVASLDLFTTKINANKNSSDSLKEGDLIELECVGYNAKPAANISWFNGLELIETSEAGAVQANGQNQKLRHKRLLQRQQIHQNSDGQTFDTHSFLSIKLSRHENGAQISCRAQNTAMRQPLVKSLELQVQRK